MRKVLFCLLFLTVSTQFIFAAEPIIITAPAEPPVKETWHLEEVWRIDAEDPDAPLIGVPNGSLIAPDGNFLVLDHQLSQVLVLSPEGEFIKTLSREGEGPGEIRRPNSIFMCSDSVLGILQGYPSKIVRLNLDGTPLSAISPPEGSGWLQQAKVAQGSVVIAGQSSDFSDPTSSKRSTTNFLKSISEDGETLFLFEEKSTVTDWSNPKHDEAKSYFPGRVWDLRNDGTLILAKNRDLYRIEFISPSGETLQIIQRPFTPYLRTKEDFEQLDEGVTYSSNGVQIDVETNFLPNDPAITSIKIHDDGTIWVTNCFGKRDLPEGIACRYDVFEADGTFRSEVSIAYEFDVDFDGFDALAEGGFIHSKNVVSASNAMYKGMIASQDDDEELADDENVELSIIRLVRAK